MANEGAAVLVVDDDLAVGKVLTALLRGAGFQGTHASSASEALQLLETRPFDVVISDVRMPGMDGIELLAQLGQRFPDLPVILLTAHGTVPMAVAAMRAGAADFMLKPFDRDEVLFVVGKALTGAKKRAEAAPEVPSCGSEIVGKSSAMADVFATIHKVASSTATVLIRGETGTGKELVAKALHEQGVRGSQPFVRVHCAALPDALLESELFGYEKGAFTGAANRKPGRVELAHRGTLFLDEIGDITPQMQVKLLRVLQEREFERVGGTQTLKVDVRFVAATHQDLEAMVASGGFREDLFYRLNVVSLRVPPLRERPEDIEPLAKHFVHTLGVANNKPGITLSASAIAALKSYAWPGNVRQLQNLMERLVVLSDENSIEGTVVEQELGGGKPAPLGPSGSMSSQADAASLDAHRHGAERLALTQALAQARNNRTLAARLLHVSRRTLYNKLREHDLM